MSMYMSVRDFLSRFGPIPVFIVFVLLLTGCSNSITLQTETEVPTPIVQKIPITLGVHFDEEFVNYIYEEDTESRPDWHIDNSKSRIALFKQVLPSMFREIRNVSSTKLEVEERQDIDAVISPMVEEMQLAMPQETYSEFYEAWIKYNIRLYTPSGELIAEWPVTGYGKFERGFMTSRNKGLNTAINDALRDIGAKLALGFPRVDPVKQWLASNVSSCYEVEGRC